MADERKDDLREIRVGLDRLLPQEDGTLLLHSMEPKDDRWRVRNYRKTLVMIEGKGYFISAIRDGEKEGCELVYHLQPWPVETYDVPGDTVIYGGAYVEARQSHIKSEHNAVVISFLLLLLSPLTGLVWESTKRRWHERWGVYPGVLTFFSIMPEFLLGLFWIVTSVILIFAQGYGGVVLQTSASMPLIFDIPALMIRFAKGWVLFLDAFIRYNYLQRYQPRFWGFYEWLFSTSALVTPSSNLRDYRGFLTKPNGPPAQGSPLPSPEKAPSSTDPSQSA